MLDPAVLDALVEAGATAEMIVAAVKADMAKDEARREAKRAGNADRQQRFRDNRKSRKGNARNALRDVTPPIEDIHTPSDFTPNGENHIQPAKPKRRKRGDNGVSLPADWQPKLGPKTQAMVDGWPPGKFDRELRKFTAHAADKGRLSQDWDAALRTWLENADEWMPKHERPTASNDEIQNPYVRAITRSQAARREADGLGVEFG